MAMFFASCMGAYRLIPQFQRDNRTAQYFGFRGSPVLGPLAIDHMRYMFRETEKKGNIASWREVMGAALQDDGSPAGAIAVTFGTSEADVVQRTQDSLWAGRVTGPLPSQSGKFYWTTSVHDVCGVDPVTGRVFSPVGPPCMEQLVSCVASGSNVTPLMGEPQRTLPAGGAGTGTSYPVASVAKPTRLRADLVAAVVALATAMTHEVYASRTSEIDAAMAQNLAGDIRPIDIGGGLSAMYDQRTDKLSLIDLEAPIAAPGQHISPGDAAKVIELWLASMPLAGLRDHRFWTVDKPLVSEIATVRGDSDGNSYPESLDEYQYVIYRKINGLPFRKISQTVWVGSGGQIDYLEITGLSDNLNGEPGLEVPNDGRFVNIVVGAEVAEAKFHNWFFSNYGIGAKPHWRWSGLVYEFDDKKIGGDAKPYYVANVAPELPNGGAPHARLVRLRADVANGEVEDGSY